MSTHDTKPRSHLPMRNTSPAGFIAYDAKDPDHQTAPIEQLRPPKGAPNVLITENKYRSSNEYYQVAVT